MRSSPRWLAEAGLEVSVDAAGNSRPPRRAPASGRVAPRQVPNGGRFDGALGVVAAIEAAERTERRSGSSSSATRSAAASEAGLRRAAAAARLPRAAHRAGAGARRAGAPLGIVTAIVGQARGRSSSRGAPTTPGRRRWPAREDALVEGGGVRPARAAVGAPGTVATVGRSRSSPARQRRPGAGPVSVDARARELGRARRARRARSASSRRTGSSRSR